MKSIYPVITIDNNLINTRRDIASMNTLEKWRDERKIELVGTPRLREEASRYSHQAASKAACLPDIGEPWILGVSRLGSAYLNSRTADSPTFESLAKILFPTVPIEKLKRNQVNDIMYLVSHFHSRSDFFVTNDTSDLIDCGKRELLKMRFGISVRTPEQLVAELRGAYEWESVGVS